MNDLSDRKSLEPDALPSHSYSADLILPRYRRRRQVANTEEDIAFEIAFEFRFGKGDDGIPGKLTIVRPDWTLDRPGKICRWAS